MTQTEMCKGCHKNAAKHSGFCTPCYIKEFLTCEGEDKAIRANEAGIYLSEIGGGNI